MTNKYKQNQPTSDDNKTDDEAQLRAQTLDRAVRLLAARPRSIDELRTRLLEKGKASPQIVESVMTKLKEYGYLNDEKFATDFAAYRLRQKAVGRHRIERDLFIKNVPREISERVVDALFEENSEEQLIDLSIKKHLARRGRPQDQGARKKLFDYLARLGYPYDLIIKKLNEIRSVSDEYGTDDI
ncbi:MAG: regulatory protein RecX [Pyrinomonadaceae bacterium]